MAAQRRIKKGLATGILCVLKYEGKATPEFIAKRFRYSATAADRAMRSLERQGVISLARIGTSGSYFLTQRGYSAMARKGVEKCSVVLGPEKVRGYYRY